MTCGSTACDDPTRAVAPSVFPEDLSNQRLQFFVLSGTVTLASSPPGIITRAVNVQHFAQPGCGKAFFLLQTSNHRKHLRYVFWLKMAKAFFSMSPSCSTRRNSLSSSCTRVSNAVAAGPLAEIRLDLQR
jgi:hypothetical protein